MPRPAASSTQPPRQTPPPIKPTLPWVRITTVTMVDKSVDQTKLAKGRTPPEIVVADKIDSAGLHWRQYDHDEPVLLDTDVDGT